MSKAEEEEKGKELLTKKDDDICLVDRLFDIFKNKYFIDHCYKSCPKNI